jgi:hypothetical protein
VECRISCQSSLCGSTLNSLTASFSTSSKETRPVGRWYLCASPRSAPIPLFM